MTLQNLDAGNLKAVDFGGLINEDVMQRVIDITEIPLPLTSRIGSDSVGNDYAEWVIDKLEQPVLGGWVVDGADSDKNDTKTGQRVGNHCGILTKEIRTSSRADASDTIGYATENANQVIRRSKELRRDVEANALGTQGSQASDPDSDVPGIPAGLAAQMTAFDTGSGGSGGVFSAGIWSAWTAGAAPVPLTETMLRDACQAAYESGGDPTTVMGVPGQIRQLSEYLFTSSSRIATMTREAQGEGPAQAIGSVNMFLTDFGVALDLVDNRLQRAYDAAGTGDAASLFVMDPEYLMLSYLRGYRVEALAKTGLSEKRLMSVDWTVKCLEPDAHRVLNDLDFAAPVTQA